VRFSPGIFTTVEDIKQTASGAKGRPVMKYGVILFSTTSSVMQSEKILLKAGFVIKLIPRPGSFRRTAGFPSGLNGIKMHKLKLCWKREVNYEAYSRS